MNGQSQGRSTPFTGKKLFALTAVALMVVSCLAAFAVVDETNGVQAHKEYDKPIVIDPSGDTWVFSKASSEPDGVTLDGVKHILTLDGVDATFNIDSESDYRSAIEVISSKLNKENEPLTIILKGENKITINVDYCNGIFYNGGGGITITGTNPLSDSLSITCNGSDSYGIMADDLHVNNASVNMSFGNTSGYITGIYATGVSFTNSAVNFDFGDCLELCGIHCTSVTMTGSSFMITPSKVDNQYTGIYVGEKLIITGSIVAVNANASGTEDQSRGIVTTGGEDQDPTITNSLVSSSGRTTAVCAESFDSEGTIIYVGWDSSKFTDSTVSGSKSLDTIDLEPITGVIDTDYKFVMISPSGPEPTTTHKVTFDLNGGKGDFPVIEKPIDQPITIPSNTPTKEGFIFHCWHGSDGVDYHPGDVIPANTADLVLTAHWESSPGPAPAEDSPDYTAIYVVIALFAILLVIGVVFGRNKDKE